MKDLKLPEPIAAYFEADKRDGHAVASCFTQDGLVKDERRTYVGAEEIAVWKTASSSRFTYSVEPFALEKKGDDCIVSGRVTGSFPGSPVVLHYRFSLKQDKIGRLEIRL